MPHLAPLPIPLDQYPEPFRSHEDAITRRLPNAPGIPGSALAVAAMHEGRKAGRECPTPAQPDTHALPLPLPPFLSSALRQAMWGSDPAIPTLVRAYWAFGFLRGVYDQMPRILGAKRAAACEGAPEWAEWFRAYALAGFRPSKAFWPCVPSKPLPVIASRTRCIHGMIGVCDACTEQASAKAKAEGLAWYNANKERILRGEV